VSKQFMEGLGSWKVSRSVEWRVERRESVNENRLDSM
jgi:hypothetical protein